MNKSTLLFFVLFFYGLTSHAGPHQYQDPGLEETYHWLVNIMGENFDEEKYALKKLPELTDLDLQALCVKGQDLRYIAPLTKLRRLNLANDDCGENVITGHGLRWLGNLTQLEFLDLDHNDVHPLYFFYLRNLKNLKTIKLTANGLSGKEFYGLLFVENMKDLILTQNNINDSSIVNLSVLSFHQNLERLDIGDNPITGDGLKALRALKIKGLDLMPTGRTRAELDDSIVPTIKAMKNLKLLNIERLKIPDGLMSRLFSTQIKYLRFSNYELSLDERLEMIRHSNIEVVDISSEVFQDFQDQGRVVELQQALSERDSLALDISGFDSGNLSELRGLTNGLPVKTLKFSSFDTIETESAKLELFPGLEVLLIGSAEDYLYLKRSGELEQLQDRFGLDVYYIDDYIYK